MFRITCCLIMLWWSSLPVLLAQQKHALIVAIGQYHPAVTNWQDLSSGRDVQYIKELLQKQQFPPANISVLQDSAATVAGIKTAFSMLISQVKSGDIVVIHFSAHGVQLQDDNGDETDGMDEAIVPFGAVYPADFSKLGNYVGAYLRDDDFGTFMTALRSKLGSKGNVLVFLDACHSGSGTRGNAVVRGGKAALVSPQFVLPTSAFLPPQGVLMDGATNDAGLSPYVVISAARSEQLNYETKNDNNEFMGSLTYALSKAFAQLQAGTTYRQLYAQVLSTMNDEVPNQNPVLEGNVLDQELFGGDMQVQQPYVAIKTLDGTTLTLEDGQLRGLDVGAKVALHKAGAAKPSPNTLLAIGSVTAATPFSATVTLEKEADIVKESDGWIFITEPIFTSPMLNAKVVEQPAINGFSVAGKQIIADALATVPMVKLASPAELLITHGATKDSIILASNGMFFGSFTNTDVLLDQLRHYRQYTFLKALEIKDPAYDVTVRLLPVINGKTDTTLQHSKLNQGLLEFEEGDLFYISAKNNTQRGLYINILDLQPDGLISPVFPNKQFPVLPSELRLNAGQERVFPYLMKIGPPFGMETYKIFVSAQEIDMETIALSNGSRPRANLSAVQELVNESFGAASRGTTITRSVAPDGAVFSLVFKIKPAE